MKLCQKVCRQCVNTHRHYHNEDLWKWDGRDNSRWCRAFVGCPSSLSKKHRPFYIFEVPEHCPFAVEHVCAQEAET